MVIWLHVCCHWLYWEMCLSTISSRCGFVYHWCYGVDVSIFPSLVQWGGCICLSLVLLGGYICPAWVLWGGCVFLSITGSVGWVPLSVCHWSCGVGASVCPSLVLGLGASVHHRFCRVGASVCPSLALWVGVSDS